MEKNIANSAAKNISSLESQTIVPTATMFGRVNEWIWFLAMPGAAVTRSLCRLRDRLAARGPDVKVRAPQTPPAGDLAR
ncbi:hypothetical protein Voc01_036310 [Virgisporangium ochraceum]|uniref:Uncharacterized protein n=1 Tax=Virgisporangium ochraceum TaxID=65505 RepID=A0A8J3ZRR2_9ACTN|nr:hypothetical protein Voc01_036310 [Virgisporangium ochraceum]